MTSDIQEIPEVTYQNKLREVACETRKTIQAIVDEGHPITNRIMATITKVRPNAKVAFPHTWCYYASCVLAYHIARILNPQTMLLCLWQPEGSLKAHWGLRGYGCDVDINEDPFVHSEEPVVVTMPELRYKQFSRECTEDEPFLSRQRQSACFERLVDRLDAEVDHRMDSFKVCIMRQKWLLAESVDGRVEHEWQEDGFPLSRE